MPYFRAHFVYFDLDFIFNRVALDWGDISPYFPIIWTGIQIIFSSEILKFLCIFQIFSFKCRRFLLYFAVFISIDFFNKIELNRPSNSPFSPFILSQIQIMFSPEILEFSLYFRNFFFEMPFFLARFAPLGFDWILQWYRVELPIKFCIFICHLNSNLDNFLP